MIKRRIRRTHTGSWHWECYLCYRWGFQWTWADCLAALQDHADLRCADWRVR